LSTPNHLEDWGVVALAVFELTRGLPVACEFGEWLPQLHLEIQHLVFMVFFFAEVNVKGIHKCKCIQIYIDSKKK
jgi:hypothetical protein